MTHTCWERTYKAVHALAEIDAPLRERLEVALVELSPLQEHEFPTEVNETFHKIWDPIDQANDPTGQGKIDAYLSSATDRDVQELAEHIVSLYDSIARDHCTPD